MKNRKVRSPAAQKKLMEKERAERLDKIAQRIDEKNDLEDAGIKVFEYPLPRADGERPSQVGGVSVKHGSKSIFRKLGNK